MRRGTTPTHTFHLPFDADMDSKVRIIYAQNDEPVFTKETADCTMKDMSITTKLMQEETLMLDQRKNVQIQLRVITTTGDAMASNVITKGVLELLEDEVL